MKYLVSVLFLFFLSSPLSAQIPVTDGANLAQGAQQLLKLIKQIQQQKQQLENELQMISNQMKDLENLDFSFGGDIESDLNSLFDVMGETAGLMKGLSEVDSYFEDLYPDFHLGGGPVEVQELIKRRDDWIAEQDMVIKEAAKTGAYILESLPETNERVATLVSDSQAAVGNLQVSQAGNQLTAVVAEQLVKLNSLMAEYTQATLTESAERRSERAINQAALKALLAEQAEYRGKRVTANIFQEG